MADINTIISLCSVKITPVHQLTFKNITEQQSYFNSKVVCEYSNCRYQDKQGIIRVAEYVDNISANYGFFENDYNGTIKRYYFWILDKNLIAKKTTELTIAIDFIQTWYFDMQLQNCIIERCHVSDDEFGKHTYPEDFELGDYIVTNKMEVGQLKGDMDYFVSFVDADGSGSLYGQVYSALCLKYFKHDNRKALTEFINKLCKDGKADSICYVFCYPHNFLADVDIEDGVTISQFPDSRHNISFDCFSEHFYNLKDSVGYKPYNKKLYTYPFNFLTIKNSNGSNVVLKFEYFSDGYNFLLQGMLAPNPTFTLTPTKYGGKDFSIADSISEQSFPLCSWINDNYSNWYAQHRNTINAQSVNAVSNYNASKLINYNNYKMGEESNNVALQQNMINSVTNAITSLGSLNILGAGIGSTNGIINAGLSYNLANKQNSNGYNNNNLLNKNNYQNTMRSLLASVKDAQVQPNTCKGDTSSNGLDVSRGTSTFFIEQTMIKKEYAQIIDMYFQMYGYQVNFYASPVHYINNRKRWNFIKTVNCVSLGDIPQQDREEINKLFNNGITFWHDDSYMYMYDIENEVL